MTIRLSHYAFWNVHLTLERPFETKTVLLNFPITYAM